jgi:porin
MTIRAQDLSEDGFATPNSVEGTLAATAERQSAGGLEGFQAWKKELEGRTGLSFGFDNQVQYLGTNSDRTPSDAASNVFRVYGTWTATGRGTPNEGALVFKLENRSAIGSFISTQALGPSLGYAGVFSSTYSDAGWVLTNLYWRQRFANGRGSLVIGHVDTYDYVNVNSLASPWVAFTNLEFEQQSTYAGPGQGLGAAIRWRINNNWLILAGFANANADASDPIKSAQKLFDTGETFKHVGISWSPDWDDRFNQSVQLTLWQVDERTDAGVPSGRGASLVANARFDAWTPFFRAGYADGGGRSLDRSVSIGTGYDARGGKDLAGLGLNWGRAPGNSRDQYSLEAFYRYDLNDFVQITPSIQYVVNPANDPTTDDILVGGLRLRVAF